MQKYSTAIAISFLGVCILFSTLLRQPAAVPFQPPVANWTQAVSDTITDPGERLIRSALYQQLADTLAHSGDKIKTTDDLGKILRDSQQFRSGKFEPEKYAELNKIVGGEFAKQLDCQDKTQPLTHERKAKAIEFFGTLSEALK